MKNFVREMQGCKYIILGIKLLSMLIIAWLILQPVFAEGFRPYYEHKNYEFFNEFSDIEIIQEESEVRQKFIAKGNILTNLKVYFLSADTQNITFAIQDTSGRNLKELTVHTSDYSQDIWNTIAIDCYNLRKGEEYFLLASSDIPLSSLCVNRGQSPEVFLECTTPSGKMEGTLVAGFQFTWSYVPVGNIFEMLFKFLFLALLIIILGYSVYRFEILCSSFKLSEKKQGFWYAVFFAVSLVLFVNPLANIQNEVNEFKRVIGKGIMHDVDVSRRISNFNHWIFLFAVSFMLFFLAVNDFFKKERDDESRKILSFANNFIVLANVHLVFRCIVYFQNGAAEESAFSYSTYLIALIFISVFAYVILHLGKNISVRLYSQLLLTAFCLGYPIAILINEGWQSGRLLFGIQARLFFAVIILAKFLKYLFKNEKVDKVIAGITILFSVIPFGTSFYIEFINILNQHGIFVANLRKYYGITILLGVTVTVVYCIIVCKKNWKLNWWKKWSFPMMIFGISCLSVQVALEDIYYVNIFESANASILISDFLNFGSIPLVEHYGGHMMTGVWEGIFYAFLNNDMAGAIFSPYYVYLKTLLAVLFFYFLKYVWDENMAFFTVLLFPFYRHWEYFGMGMLVYLATVAYIKKNSYVRAAMMWFAFIWCAIYRLELGFAFGFACVMTLLVYVILHRNWKAVKEICISFTGWLILGSIMWCGLCIEKGIHPVKRLWEFLMLSMSNQNWAYEAIGDMGNMAFVWMYLFLPFMMAICLLYIIFSKKMREQIGVESWILLLFMGISYFGNFSRGLVRHSLAENATIVMTWSVYVFLAMLFCCKKNNRRLFLPIFTVLILCNTVLIQKENFVEGTIADLSAVRTGEFTDEWVIERSEEKNYEGKITYWEELQRNREKVVRAKWDKSFDKMIYSCEILMDTLLEEDETFVDFINKTFIYSAVNRRNPVYVSQSPLQLSGEYTQQQFIEEIEGIPLILMPFEDGYALDTISNLYRYYKVVEYICQNYVPLCKVEDSYAVWCLPEKYEIMKEKIKGLPGYVEEDYRKSLVYSDKLEAYNCEIIRNFDNFQIKIISGDGILPGVEGLENFIDLKMYAGTYMQMSIGYNTDIAGNMKVFYTTEEGEAYTDDKMLEKSIEGNGEVEFLIPVTDYTRLKFSIPEGSVVDISSLKVKNPYELIDYGYDGPNLAEDSPGNQIVSYMGLLHNYVVCHLPRLWAEKDRDKAVENPTVTELTECNGVYTFDSNSVQPGSNGNYLLIKAAYDGLDQEFYYSDDEILDVTVKLGFYKDGVFTEKYQYAVTLQEGYHDYLIRVSNDYYWYLKEVNAVYIDTDSSLHDVSMKILEGD